MTADRIAFHRWACVGFLAVLALVAVGLSAPAHAAASAPSIQAASSSAYPPIQHSVKGPSIVGKALKAEYNLTASGGPALAANGTTVGFIDFNVTLSGTNVTSASVDPPTGVLLNGSVILTFTAPNLSEVVTMHIKLTSSYNTTNETTNFTQSIQIVPPYVLTGTLVAGPTAVTGFNMTVTLDGTPVGVVKVPTIQANSTYTFTYDYVPVSLAPGWHTIAVSLTPEHGLVEFKGGVQQISLDFYIAGAPPDYALDVGIGIAAFAGAVFIWGAVVAARRRGRRAR